MNFWFCFGRLPGKVWIVLPSQISAHQRRGPEASPRVDSTRATKLIRLRSERHRPSVMTSGGEILFPSDARLVLLRAPFTSKNRSFVADSPYSVKLRANDHHQQKQLSKTENSKMSIKYWYSWVLPEREEHKINVRIDYERKTRSTWSVNDGVHLPRPRLSACDEHPGLGFNSKSWFGLNPTPRNHFGEWTPWGLI